MNTLLPHEAKLPTYDKQVPHHKGRNLKRAKVPSSLKGKLGYNVNDGFVAIAR